MAIEEDLKELLKFNRINFEDITYKHNATRIETEALIIDITEPTTVMTGVVFSCHTCRSYNYKRLYYPYDIPKTPKVCEECNSHNTMFLDTEKSNYIQLQTIKLSTENTHKEIETILTGPDCSYDYNLYDKIKIQAIVEMKLIKKNNYKLTLRVIRPVTIEPTNESKPTVTDNRTTPGYNEWVEKIKQRDKKCQICGGHKHLEAHHLYNYKNYPKLRLDTGNGILLCTFCHNKFHSYYGKNVTPADLIRYIHRFPGG